MKFTHAALISLAQTNSYNALTKNQKLYWWALPRLKAKTTCSLGAGKHVVLF